VKDCEIDAQLQKDCAKRHLSEAERNFATALEKVLACKDPRKWDDLSQEAFNLLRKSVVHLPVEALDGYEEHALRVFTFLLNNYAVRSMNRNLIMGILHRLLSSVKWRDVAKDESMVNLATDIALEMGVSGSDSLGTLRSLGKEKVAQFFGIFGVHLDTLSAAPRSKSVARESSHHVWQSRFVALSLCVVMLCGMALSCHDSVALCASMQCPEHYLPKGNATITTCAGRTCTSSVDLNTCCVKMQTCESFRCPESYSLKSNATQIYCPSNCAWPADLERCCDKIATCSSFHCPKWYHLKKDADRLKCLTSSCSEEADLERCCELAIVSSGLKGVQSVQSFFANVLTCPGCISVTSMT